MKRPGLSLTELLVSITIMSIIILIVSNIYIGSGRFVTAEQSRIDVGENASRALSTLDAVLRTGKAILASTIYSGTTYTTGDQTLVFTSPSLLSDGTLSLTDDDTFIVYLDSTDPAHQRIRLITAGLGASSTRTTGTIDLVQGVQDLYFRYTTDDVTGSTTVAVTITTQTTINKLPFTKALILNVTFRNHQ